MVERTDIAERIEEWLNKKVTHLTVNEAQAADLLEEAVKGIEELREALKTIRSLVKEGGVPRYSVTPGAALNAVIEEAVDPALNKWWARWKN